MMDSFIATHPTVRKTLFCPLNFQNLLVNLRGVNTLSKLKLESKLRKQTDFGDIFNNQYFKQTHFSKLIH